MCKEIKKIFILISLITTVTCSQAVVVTSMTIFYKKPFVGTTAGNNFFYSIYPITGGYSNPCPNNSVVIYGATQYPSSQSQGVYSIPVESYNTNTLSFSPYSPKPIYWAIEPFNSCLSNYSGGTTGVSNIVANSPNITTGVFTYQFSYSGPVFQVTTQGPLTDYLPPYLTYTDSNTHEVFQLYFAGCSDYITPDGSNNPLTDMACCYTVTQGDTAACGVNQP